MSFLCIQERYVIIPSMYISSYLDGMLIARYE